jgi:anaerobic magnesium-protoporphyrin IX monomethyl ester cyclase
MRISFIIQDYHESRNSYPMGTAYLARVLRDCGHEIEIYNMAIYHWTIEQMLEYFKKEKFGAICVSFICGYYTYTQIKLVLKALNSIPKRPPIILGGHGPAPVPEFFLIKHHTEFVSLGEAEKTLPRLIEAIEKEEDTARIDGFACRVGDEVIINKKLDPVQDLDTIPFPAWDLFPMEAYIVNHAEPSKPMDRFGVVTSSRGCPYLCNFCYRMEDGIRFRSVDNVMEEIGWLVDKYNINYFQFQDELLMVSRSRISEICDGIEKNGFKFEFYLNGRLNIVTKDMLKRLKELGCRFINYGIESADEVVLKNMDKRLTLKQIHEGLQATIDAGIEPGVNLLFGNIGDTRETFRKNHELLLKYDTFCQNRTIKPVSPFPGTPLYNYAIKEGLIKDAEDFYERLHMNSDRFTVNFSDVPDKEAYDLIFEANKDLVSEYHRRKAEAQVEGLRKVYSGSELGFRGVR